MLELILADHCAPALAGIKPSNMISLFKDKIPDISGKVKELNGKLNKKDIYIDVLCECPKRFLLIVYRKKKLTAQLKNPEIAAFLASFGYDENGSVEDYLEKLRARIRFDKNFPHEIGAFLGYPLHDISGYMQGAPCLYTGEWKVYDDLQNAQKMFCRFKNCRNAIMQRVSKGQSLAQIFYAA